MAMVQACVGQSVYIYGPSNGSNPNTGSFTTNAPLIVNTTVIRISICDMQSMSNYFPLDAIQVGGTIILTSRLSDSVKFIFKVTSILPPYIINSVVQFFNFNVQFLWGSQYNPTENYDEFYIDFGIVDTMRPYCPPYMVQGNYQQNAIVPCPPMPCPPAPTTCGCSKPPCNCHHQPPLPVPSSDEVLNTYKSTGSFLYKYDSNYAADTNPILSDAAGGTFRINGSTLDSSTFIQMSTTDGSDTPYNNASYLNSVSAGSTLSLYNVTTGKRCIFTLTTSTSQTSSTVSSATQLNPTLYGSYVFKVRSISTDYGLVLTQGDSYIVTFTISSGTAGGAIAALVTDLVPGSGNTVSLGSLYSTIKDIYVGPNSLYISSYKFGCDASGNLVVSNTATGAGAPAPFSFNFVENTTVINTLSTIFTPAALTSISTITTGTSGSNLTGLTTGTSGSNLTAITSGTSGSNLSSFVTILNTTTISNLTNLTTGPSGSNLSTLVGSSSNISTAGSILSATAGGTNYVLTKTTNGLATWAAPSAAGTTFVSDNSMIVSTLSGVYTVTSTISTAAAFLGSAIVASNASTVASVVSATPGGAGYVLTKGLTGLPAWAAASGGGGGGSGTTPIMVNIVYSNTQATPTLWNDTGTANSILLDSNIMVASNAANLPTGWMLGFATAVGSGYTQMYLSTTGALNYNARQMTPVNVRFLYAKTTSGGATVPPQALSWTSVAADGDSMSATSASAGQFGNISCVPLTTGLDNQSMYHFIKGGTTYSAATSASTTPNFQIPPNANAILVKIYFEFNLASTA